MALMMLSTTSMMKMLTRREGMMAMEWGAGTREREWMNQGPSYVRMAWRCGDGRAQSDSCELV